MESNTTIKRPEWLTDEKIEEYRGYIADCDNPYTKEEVVALPFDGARDMKRYRAYMAIEALTEYGLM